MPAPHSESGTNPQPAPAPHPAALAHLEEVLSSPAFAGAKRQQRLLRFLVEKRLAGEADALKEYSLGLEVFDRGEDFDPRLDPIVRVEASRLRARLKKYYDATPGALRIELPRGGYVPLIVTVADSTGVPEPAPAPVARRRGPWLWLALAGGALALLGALVLWPRKGARPAHFEHFTRLTREDGRFTSPSLSPDGRQVVYARRQGHDWDICVRGSDGSAERNLTASYPGDDRQPALSPDGRQIAFRSERDGGGLYLMDADGGHLHRLVERGFLPAWSPDGARIVFASDSFNEPGEDLPERHSRLLVVEVKSGAVRELTAPPAVPDAIQPAWSPDGRRIAFWGADGDGHGRLWTILADARPGLPAVAVTADPALEWSPAWSRDGRWLYYASDRGGVMNLWRVALDGGGKSTGQPEAVATPSSNSGWCTFSADGRRFAYVRRLMFSKLYRGRFDPQTGTLTQPLEALTAGERRLREPAVSADGRWLAARIQDPQEDIVVMRPDGSGLRRVTNDAYADRVPRWSPDGRELMFYSNRGGRFEVWSVQPDGGQLRRLFASREGMALLPDRSWASYPPDGRPFLVLGAAGARIPEAGDLMPQAWSPDGRYAVAGRLEPDGHRALVVFAPASGESWHVPGPGGYPVWLPDSRGILFADAHSIRLADVRNHTVKTVYAPSGVDMHGRFAISPDGRSLFLVQMEDEEDVWLGGGQE